MPYFINRFFMFGIIHITISIDPSQIVFASFA